MSGNNVEVDITNDDGVIQIIVCVDRLGLMNLCFFFVLDVVVDFVACVDADIDGVFEIVKKTGHFLGK